MKVKKSKARIETPLPRAQGKHEKGSKALDEAPSREAHHVACFGKPSSHERSPKRGSVRQSIWPDGQIFGWNLTKFSEL